MRLLVAPAQQHSPLCRRLRGYHDGRRQAVRRRTTPFNLKAGGRGAKSPLLRVPAVVSPKWFGPTITLQGAADSLGYPRGAATLSAYTMNSWSFLLALPRRPGPMGAPTLWAHRTLRGLTGRVSTKLRFKGKSFRWHRRGGGLTLRFGHSHLVTCTPPPHTRWKRHGKVKMLFFHTNVAVLREFLLRVVQWREPNRYHSRGLRLSRQQIARKAGKVSAYR